MTDYLRVLGCDPGPIPGVVVLDFAQGALRGTSVFQCSANAAPDLVNWLIRDTPPSWRLLVQTERFVVGSRSARSSSAGAGQITRDLVNEIARVCGGQAPLVLRNAGSVKPWATDERLDRAGLLDATKGMRHARDAARHALHCAVNHGGVPDPRSKKWSA